MLLQLWDCLSLQNTTTFSVVCQLLHVQSHVSSFPCVDGALTAVATLWLVIWVMWLRDFRSHVTSSSVTVRLYTAVFSFIYSLCLVPCGSGAQNMNIILSWTRHGSRSVHLQTEMRIPWGTMSAIVALCHFCEVHGPSVVMVTQSVQDISEDKISDKSSSNVLYEQIKNNGLQRNSSRNPGCERCWSLKNKQNILISTLVKFF